MLIGFYVSVAIFVACIIGAVINGKVKYKKDRIITPRRIIFFGTAVAAFCLFVPIYFGEYNGDNAAGRVIKTVFVSVHQTIRLFVVDCDFEIIENATKTMQEKIAIHYFCYSTVIFVLSPLLTIGILLSFFKNLYASLHYLRRFYSDTYIFSELNERALALAKSIRSKTKKCTIIFTDVYDSEEKESYELIEKAKELGAICFKKDMCSINFKVHSKGSVLAFFAIGNKEDKNVNQSFDIIKSYNKRKNTMLYLFSSSTDSELIMTSANKGEVKVRRINSIRSLIYRTLYDMEETVLKQRAGGVPEEEIKKDLFMGAKEPDPIMRANIESAQQQAKEQKNECPIVSLQEIKQIGAVVIGCGSQGTEMVKALSWFCQMDGYVATIDVFDKDKCVESKFTAQCPELMSIKYNNFMKKGEAYYNIKFHTDIEDVGTTDFVEEIKKLTNTTYVFVALGSDEENIKVATNLRVIFERMEINPTIHAVVYNSDKKRALSGLKNYKGQLYNIDFIGDMDTIYSHEVIINSELEQDALKRHQKYGASEEEFWAYEYNYRSSMATAVHAKARLACRILGADKTEKEMTEQDKRSIEILEHCRWNAYMRSEGYIYPPNGKRNDLGKMHHDLVHYNKLSDEEKGKDSRVGAKHD